MVITNNSRRSDPVTAGFGASHFGFADATCDDCRRGGVRCAEIGPEDVGAVLAFCSACQPDLHGVHGPAADKPWIALHWG
jgi:hypothetical protein